MMHNRQKLISLGIVIIFVVAICTPLLITCLQENKTISYTEKRKLAQCPKLPVTMKMLKQFPEEFERYFNDQFGMRESFLKTFSAIKSSIGDAEITNTVNKVPTKNTVKGKNGWFFLNRVWDGDPISDYRNISLYSEVGLLRATFVFAARNDWLKRKGIRYLLFFAPNKHTIYAEYMPDYIVKEGDISSMDQLYDALSRYTSIEFVDLRDVLRNNKKEAHRYWKDKKKHAAIYNKTDSHWNGAGADIAQYEIAKRIEKMFPGRITPRKRPLNDFKMTHFSGDISLIMGRTEKTGYGPAIFTGKCSKATREEFSARQQVTTCKTEILNSLIFHDSFYSALKPFFADYFAKTTFLWERMNQKAVLEQLKKGRINLVIEERAERFLPYTPDIRSEDYNDFWALHFKHWKKEIFALDTQQAAKNSKNYASRNVKLTYNKSDDSLVMDATTKDPMLLLSDIPFKANRLYMVHITMDSRANTQLQIFYSSNDPSKGYPKEKYSRRHPIKKGSNNIYIPLFSGNLGDRLRFDPGSTKGIYHLKNFTIRELTASSFKHVR